MPDYGLCISAITMRASVLPAFNCFVIWLRKKDGNSGECARNAAANSTIAVLTRRSGSYDEYLAGPVRYFNSR